MSAPRIALLVATTLLALGLWGCDSASPSAPSGTILSVSANPSRIGLEGESTITVRGFRPNGSPLHPGTQITISADLGDLQPIGGTVPGGLSVIAVDDEGVALFRLVADGRTGTATVTATAPPAEAQGSVAVQIGEDASSRPTLLMSANPSTIPVLGSAIISMLGRNPDGTPVRAGERIRLTADLGDIACDGSPNGGCREVFTDQNGEAEATFIAGDRGGTGRVSAVLGTSEEASVQINIREAVASIFLAADRQSIQRVETGTDVTLSALLQDAKGEPVSGTVVVFEAVRGVLSDNRVPSNAQGEATTVLTVRSDDVRDIPANGTFEVRATVISEGITRSASLLITVLGSP